MPPKSQKIHLKRLSNEKIRSNDGNIDDDGTLSENDPSLGGLNEGESISNSSFEPKIG